MAVTTVAPTPDHQLRPHSTDQDVAVDGDVRYNAGIVGYDRDNRKRVRDTEHQVNLLVTARIRDQRTAVFELHPDSLPDGLAKLNRVIGLFNAGEADSGDVRAEMVSLAATAIIQAEAVDRPWRLAGARLLPLKGSPHLRVA